jgi:hypothetical protein
MRNCAAKEALNRHVARTPDEVYSVVANLLYINGIVGRDAVMNAQELPQVKVPNADGLFQMAGPGDRVQATRSALCLRPGEVLGQGAKPRERGDATV